MNKPRIQYHALNSIKSSLAIVIFFLMFCSGCDEPEVQIIIPPKPPPPISPLDSNVALYLSLDSYYGPGLIILNANSFKVLDTLFTYPGVPWTIEFSPDNTTWYSCWDYKSKYSLYSGNIQPLTVNQKVLMKYAKSALVKSANQNYIITYGYRGIDIFDRATLSLIHSDTNSVLDVYSGFRASPNYNKLYFPFPENREIIGIGIYDLDSLKITDTLRLFDDGNYPGLQSIDFVISPDDRYLYLSVWNWRGDGGFGSFIVINLLKRKIESEFLVGSFSQLAISPDGNNVYISDPGGYLRMFFLSGKVWKYNVQTNTMHVFLKSLYNTDKIAVADDNRTIFISAWLQTRLPNGSDASIVKVDALSGEILDSYPLPLDSLGVLTSLIRNIRLGTYPMINSKNK